jgi:hypothetical protein
MPLRGLLLSCIMVNSLKIFEILRTGSIPEESARVMTLAIQQAESESNADLKEFIHREFEGIRHEFEIQSKLFATKVELAALETRLVRWMFAFWIGQTAVIAGLMLEVTKLLK